MEHAMQIYKYRFLKRIIAFVKDKHGERSIIARYDGRSRHVRFTPESAH
jgi:hypothetical protein